MKVFLILLLGTVSLVGQTAVTPVDAPQTELTPAQKESLMKQIAELELSLKTSRSAKLQAAMEAFKLAALGEKEIYEFYLACQKELMFKDKKETEFREWRDRNEDKVKNRPQLLVMGFQLRYLVLSIKALQVEDPATLMPEVRSLLKEMVTATSELDGALQQLRAPVHETPFAKVYEINPLFRVENWSMAPLNLAETYGKFLIPAARTREPGIVLALWDERIAMEKAMIDSENEEALESFTTQVLPGLLWQRSKERFAMGDQVQGLADLIRVIRENAQHPNAVTWLAELKEMASEPTAPASDASGNPAPQGTVQP